MEPILIVLVVLILITTVILIAFRNPAVQQRFGKMAGEAYQKRFFKQIKKNFPLLAERLEGYEMSPERQAAFQAQMMRLPPQEAMKLQAEFNRLRDNFMTRHPELAPLINAGQDAKAQAKAVDDIMKLPAEKRQAIEKDLLWALDQLRGRFPKLVGPLEATLKKKPTT